MKSRLLFPFLLFVFAFTVEAKDGEVLNLPAPRYNEGLTVGEALNRRTSVRSFKAKRLAMNDIADLLWASSGKTFDGTTAASRTYPSAGGLHPLNVYIMAASLGLGTVAVGAFVDEKVENILDLRKEVPLYLLPVGYPSKE
jgi:nitroreductase